MKKRMNFDVANFVTTGLPAYVAENRDLLIADLVLGSSTLERISVQTGVKHASPIHILEFDEELQAMGCNPDLQDENLSLVDRTITAVEMGFNIPICKDNLLGTWGEYAVRVTASDEDLPFEEYVVDAIIANAHNKLEKLMWQGSTTNGDLIDGFVTIATADAPAGNKIPIAAGTSAYDGVLLAYLALPEEALERNDVEIYVSPAIFRAFVQDIVASNLYHFDPANATAEEIFLPGTTAKVVKRAGLAGNLNILATYAKNLYFGTDLENAREDVAIAYSLEKRTNIAQLVFTAGVQIAFPDRVVLGTFAAAPTATGSYLAKIASTVDEDANAINTVTP